MHTHAGGTAFDFDLETAAGPTTPATPNGRTAGLSSSSFAGRSPPLPSTSMHTTGRAGGRAGASETRQQQGEKGEDDLAGPPSSFLPLPDPRAHTPSRSQQELEALGVVLQVCAGCFACWWA